MKLIEMTVNGYMDALSSGSPAPGGGSASALIGAQGASLLAMVGRLTLGKKKYIEFEETASMAISEGEQLKRELLEAVDRDTEAFNLVSAAYGMPKEFEQEKAARRAAIAKASLAATLVPLKTMELGTRGLEIARSLAGKSNKSAASDLGVAALNLLACVSGAWLNVQINLGSLESGQTAESLREQGRGLMARADALARQVSEGVSACL